MRKVQKIGFIGLGVMGEPICRNLTRKAGVPVMAFDLSAEPLQRLAVEGAEIAASPAQLCSSAMWCSSRFHPVR